MDQISGSRSNSTTPYIAPPDVALTITSNSANLYLYSKTYTAAGYINYICSYFNDNGTYTAAGWRVSGETAYHNGEKKYALATYTVQFQSVSEHATPANTQITINTKGSSKGPYYVAYQRTVFYVDKINGNDTSNKGGKYNRYVTIQKALNSLSQDNGNVYVAYTSLQYYENITAPIYSVIVRGEGSYMTYVHGTHNMSRGTISAVNIHFEP